MDTIAKKGSSMQEFRVQGSKGSITVRFSQAENAPAVEDVLVKILNRGMEKMNCQSSEDEL